MIKHGFTTGRFIIGQRMQAGLAKVNHQLLYFFEANLKEKVSFLFSLNEMVLFLYIVLMKARREITTIQLKIASSLLSRKYRNKEGEEV